MKKNEDATLRMEIHLNPDEQRQLREAFARSEDEGWAAFGAMWDADLSEAAWENMVSVHSNPFLDSLTEPHHKRRGREKENR
jgi:hypothetical protein